MRKSRPGARGFDIFLKLISKEANLGVKRDFYFIMTKMIGTLETGKLVTDIRVIVLVMVVVVVLVDVGVAAAAVCMSCAGVISALPANISCWLCIPHPPSGACFPTCHLSSLKSGWQRIQRVPPPRDDGSPFPPTCRRIPQYSPNTSHQPGPRLLSHHSPPSTIISHPSTPSFLS